LKIVIIGIAIVIVGALFVLQDFGGEITPEPEQPVIKRAVDKEPTSSPQTSPQTSQQSTQPTPKQTQPTTQSKQVDCDPSYPAVCIPPYPPDLDCDEIQFSNFRVVPPDPHGFDRDRDGTGCEVGSARSSEPVKATQENNCDPSYPEVCIPEYPPDLDCGEIGYSNFKVLQPDPHRFDGDKDGIGCES
jgi:hypothetical protein